MKTKWLIVIVVFISVATLTCSSPLIGKELKAGEETGQTEITDAELRAVATETKSTSSNTNSAETQTNDQGIAAISDTAAQLIIPIKVTDTDNIPLESIAVNYVSTNGSAILSVHDPAGNFEPDVIIIPLSETEADKAPENLLDELSLELSVQPVSAQSKFDFGIRDVVFFVLEHSGAARNIRKIYLNPEQVFASSSGYEYYCTSPERLEAMSQTLADVILLALPDGGLATTVADKLIDLLIENGIAKNIDQPILFKKYLYPAEVERTILFGLIKIPANVTKRLAVMEYVPEEIGTCIEVPDLIGKTAHDARITMEELELEWEETCVGVDCLFGEVIGQDPLLFEETILGRKVRLFPVGVTDLKRQFEIVIKETDSPAELDLYDYQSVLFWMNRAFTYGNLEVFEQFIRNTGVGFTAFGAGFTTPDYNNDSEVIQILDDGLKNSDEIICMGYELQGRKLAVLYQGMKLEVAEVEEIDSTSWVFGFFMTDDGYELRFLAKVHGYQFEQNFFTHYLPCITEYQPIDPWEQANSDCYYHDAGNGTDAPSRWFEYFSTMWREAGILPDPEPDSYFDMNLRVGYNPSVYHTLGKPCSYITIPTEKGNVLLFRTKSGELVVRSVDEYQNPHK